MYVTTRILGPKFYLAALILGFHSPSCAEDPAVPAPRKTAMLCSMSLDGRQIRPIYQYSRAGFLGSPSWSRDGSRIAFDANSGDGHIFVIPATGGEARDLGLGARPDWSADGSRIVFWLPAWFERGAANDGIWIMNVDGSERLHVCKGESPRWSPRRDEIAVARNTESSGNLFLVDLVTNDERPLLKSAVARVFAATWSPDGSHLAYMAKYANGQMLLAIVNRDGEERGHQRLLEGDFIAEHSLSYPSWSPDGQVLLFSLQSAEGQSVAIMKLPDGEPTVIRTSDAGHQTDPTWSADGKSILYATHR